MANDYYTARANEIRITYENYEKAQKDADIYLVKTGKMLVEMRGDINLDEGCPYDTFEAWVEEHMPFGPEWAKKMIRVAESDDPVLAAAAYHAAQARNAKKNRDKNAQKKRAEELRSAGEGFRSFLKQIRRIRPRLSLKLRRGYSRDTNDALGVDPLELVAEAYGFQPADLSRMLSVMKREGIGPVVLIHAITDDEDIPACASAFDSPVGDHVAH